MDGDITAADIESAFTAAESAPAASTTTAAPDPAAASPDTATTLPAADPQGAGETRATEGPIPFAVHKTALDNARQKAVKEALGEITPEQFRDIADWWNRARTNPDAFLTRTLLEHQSPAELLDKMLTELRNHPQHGTALKSLIGRKLAQARGLQEPTLETVPVDMGDGKIAHLVTADSMKAREAWVREQLKREQAEALQPILTEREQRATAEQAHQAEAASAQWVATTISDTLSWPGMEEEANRVALGQWLDAQTQGREISGHAMERLIDRGYREMVIPTLTRAERSKVTQDIHRQAQAGTVNPARSGTQAPKSVDEMSLRESIEAALAGRI